MEKGLRIWHKLCHLPLRILLLALCAWAVYIISVGWISPGVTPTTTFLRQQPNSWQVKENNSAALLGATLHQLSDKSASHSFRFNRILETQHYPSKAVTSTKQKNYEKFHDLNNRKNLPRKNRTDWGSTTEVISNNSTKVDISRLNEYVKNNQKTDHKWSYSEKTFELKRKEWSSSTERKVAELLSKDLKYVDKYGSINTFSSERRNARPFLMSYGSEDRPSASASHHHLITNQEITGASQISNRSIEFKTILLWTSLYSGWNFLPLGSMSFWGCSEIRCEVTSDRSRLNMSHAVLFHVRTMSLLDLPPFRVPHQKWIFFSLESPPQSYFPGFRFMHRMFNWTMTYRKDSDIVIPYGSVFPRSFSKTHIFKRRKKDWDHLWKTKTRPVIWMVSHCDTHSKRELYVHELQKFIDVDILGSCGTAVCLFNETHECLESFSRRYKFFLAFENSICDDYVTEKFFRTLKYDIVPVVLGGANYTAIAPPGSYINAADYSSPEALADYLHLVSKNFTLYRMYFRWKEVGYVVQDKPSHCSLCQKVHSSDFQSESTYNDMVNWWVKNSHCAKWKRK